MWYNLISLHECLVKNVKECVKVNKLITTPIGTTFIKHPLYEKMCRISRLSSI